MEVDRTHSLSRWVDLLESHGYRLAWRADGIVECLLVRDEERWLGRGDDRDAALAHAIAQAFPSHAARACAEVAFEAPAVPRVLPPEPAAPASPAEEKAEVAVAAPAAPPAVELAPAPPAALPAPEPPAPVRRAPRPISVPEAMAQLNALEQAVAAGGLEICAWAPRRQKLALLAWCCRARATQEACRARDVDSFVAVLAERLGDLASRFWCGSIRPLQLNAGVRDALDVLGEHAGPPPLPATWLEAAQRSEAALEEVEAQDAAEGRDEDGYADAAALHPAPPRPGHELARLVADLEARSGAVDDRPSRGRRDDLMHSLDREPEAWVQLARRVRWLRGGTVDPWTWGCAIGRLRFAASQAPYRLRDRLDAVLAADFAPPRSWAAELGADPATRELIQRRSQLLSSAPDAATAEAAAARWLFDTLDDSDLDLEQVAQAVGEGARSRVAAIEPAAEGRELERRHRRRLAKLRSLLVESQAGAAAAVAAGVAAESGSAEPPEDAEPDWIAEVVRRTRGKEALLVCNRADPEADAAISASLELAGLERIEHQIRRVQAACARIREGRYELVLSATGFQSHDVEDHVSDACRAAGVPYVRVNRARRTAVLRALAREFGLLGGQHALVR